MSIDLITGQKTDKRKSTNEIAIVGLDDDTSDKFQTMNFGGVEVLTNIGESRKQLEEVYAKARMYNQSINIQTKGFEFKTQQKRGLIDKSTMLHYANYNSAVAPCIEATNTNVAFVDWLAKESLQYETFNTEAEGEYNRFNSLIQKCNGKESLRQVIEKVDFDVLATGEGFIEVVRSMDGTITKAYHLESVCVTELTDEEQDPIEVTYFKLNANGDYEEFTETRTFKKYIYKYGNEQRLLKEFGDPRDYDAKGRELNGKSRIRNFKNSITEVIRFSEYNGYRDMALPCWISQLPLIQGLQECNVMNLDYFETRGNPTLLVTVSGGVVDESLATRIKNVLQPRDKGQKGRVAVIQAQGVAKAQGGIANGVTDPTIEIHNLAKDGVKDIFAKDYFDISNKSIRTGFRIPGVLIGLTEDHSRANSDSALLSTEYQVFEPKRRRYADTLNLTLFLDKDGRPPRLYRLSSNPPKQVQTIRQNMSFESLVGSGVISTNDIIKNTNTINGTNIELIEAKYADYPKGILEIFAQKTDKDIDTFMKDLKGIEVNG